MQSISDAQIASVNAGARLDRLPICGFHWRILALIGAGKETVKPRAEVGCPLVKS